MQKYLLLLIILIFQLAIIKSVKAQQRFVNFDTGIPSNWSATNGAEITLSNEHLKGGANALKWTPQNGSILTASSLAIPSSEINSTTSSTAQFFVYSSRVSTDTLIFRFYDGSNVLRREGRMLLNYKGWRSYHRNYRYDYNNGAESGSFTLQKMEVVYKPSTTTYNTIYLDELTLVGNTDARTPGPHMALDIQHFSLNSEYYKAYFAWINQPDMAITTATSNEQSAIAALKNSTYKRTLGTATSQEIADAKTFVTQCAITTNADGSARGRGISAIYKLDTLLQMGVYAQSLARAWGLNGDNDARSKLQTFMAYLVEQGLAEGGEIVMPYNDYTSSRNFPVGFLEALPYIADTEVKQAIIKMLKWSNEFNTIYNASPTPGMEMDFLHVKSNFLVELALTGSTDGEIARDLKSFSRYLEQFTNTGAGARDGIKPDGTGFHHNAQHISYQYAYGTWINRAYELKGTPFKVSLTAYQQMRNAVKTLFLETSKGVFYPNSASGRAPFPSSVPVNTTSLDRLVQVGGDIMGTTVEPDFAAFYNYIFQTNRYAVTAVNMDGYYQLNYAQTGLMRKNNWLAVARGFTSRMFGAEIYTGANRYGRYQSYGALEVLYDGSLANTGYIAGGNGWDWNMMPGATTVRQSYDNLKPLVSGTASEYQSNDFAGALADGNIGIFGMDFVQNAGSKYTTSGLKFKKSVFTLDDIMVCLGSGISATNSSDVTITTLFQGINASSNPAIYIKSNTATTANYNQAISVASTATWLINGQTTGYYIPTGNADVNVFRGSQTTPLNTSDNTATTATANVSKAWLSHGTKPTSAKYAFVVVPATTPQKMTALATEIEGEMLFKILEQTETLHAVQYIPANTMLYSCFAAKPDINRGYVKGISGRALFSIKEQGNTLTIKIVSPDLNAVDDAVSTWVSTVKSITLSLSGNWKIQSNPQQAGVVYGQNTLDAIFALKDGEAQTLVLEKEVLSEEEQPGTWTNQAKQWGYNLKSGTGLSGYGTPPLFQQGSATATGTYSYSTADAQAPGFLPYPPNGTAKVLIVNNAAQGNGNFTLNTTDGVLAMSASSLSSVNKFSAYGLTDVTAVANMFFRISFSATANNGTFIYAIGNKETSATNLFSNSSGVYRATTELFTALQWEFTTTGINFNFRESANTNGGIYKLISNTLFAKGGNYDVEVYANNSAYAQTYTRGGQTYTLEPGKFNIWVRPAGQLVKSSLLTYNASTAFTSSGELVQGTGLNSFLFQGINSTLPTANAAVINLSNIEMNFASEQSLPVQMVSFTGNADGKAILLQWKTASEIGSDSYKLYRSIDGKMFEPLTEIKAAGNSSQPLTYNFRDVSVPLNASPIYYRLILTDKDGAVSYNETIAIKMGMAQSTMSVYPNPVGTTLTIIYPVTESHKGTLRILDVSGKTVHVTNHFFGTGMQQLSVDVSFLKSGTYIIELAHYKQKIIKL